jgi:4-carboxymuconolactone decarboxylase
MSKAPPAPQREKLRSFMPHLVELTEDVVYGDVWERPQLSKRDRSLITVAALVALNRPDQLQGHIGRALDNGVRPEEIAELITHLALYCGWPAAMASGQIAQGVVEGREAP